MSFFENTPIRWQLVAIWVECGESGVGEEGEETKAEVISDVKLERSSLV